MSSTDPHAPFAPPSAAYPVPSAADPAYAHLAAGAPAAYPGHAVAPGYGTTSGAAPTGYAAPPASPWDAPAAAPWATGAPQPYGAATPQAYGSGLPQPYGAVPGPSYGQPFSAPGGARPARRPGALPLAVAGIVVGVLALIVLPVPGSMGGWAIGVGAVAAVLAFVALARTPRGSGRGAAVTAVVLSLLAVGAGVTLLLAVVSGLGDAFMTGFRDGYSSGAAPADDDASFGTSDAAPGPEDEEWVDMPLISRDLGESATVGEYRVTIIDIDVDADAELAEDLLNPPADGRYVTARVMLVYEGDGRGNPEKDLMLSYPGHDDWLYDETTCLAETSAPIWEIGSLEPGATATFTACMDVPADAVRDRAVLVDDMRAEEFSAELWATE